MNSTSTQAKRPRIFYGWWIVLATSLIVWYGAGTFFYGFGVFFNPIRKEFGWAAATTALAFSLYRLEGGIGAPIVGLLVDKYGPRKLMLFGTVVVGFGFLFLSRIDSLMTFYIAFLILSLGFSAGMGVVAQVAVANWFDKKRGRALGLMMLGAGGAGVVAPVLAWLLGEFGWRTTLVAIGIGTWVICVPLSTVVRHRPEDYGYLPDGELPSRSAKEYDSSDANSHHSEGMTWQEAIRTRAFWFISLAAMMSGTAISAIIIHLIPYLENVGLPRQVAALSITFLTISSLVGRLGLGWLGDIIDKRLLLAIAFAVQGIAVLFFAFVANFWMVILFLALFGPSYGGGIPLRPALMADYFGRRSFGAIQGFAQTVMTVGGILGPYIAGLVFDITGTYRTAWIVFSIISSLAVPTILLVPKPKRSFKTSAPGTSAPVPSTSAEVSM